MADHLKEKRLASLDKITADTIKSKQRWHQQLHHRAGHPNEAPPPASVTTTTLTHNSSKAAEMMTGVDHRTDGLKVVNNDRGREEDEEMEIGVSEHQGAGHTELPSFRFDEDENSDGEMNR